MRPHLGLDLQLIRTGVSHVVRTATVRDDLVGWVVCGRKRLRTPGGETRFAAGQVFALARSTQWDVVNESGTRGGYEARILRFPPQTVERFHERFGQFSSVPAIQGCAGTQGDAAFQSTFGHATAALQDPEMSAAVREHRALEVLLLLAERGLVFAPVRELRWSDRVHRFVSHRPQADWTVQDLAHAFHMSASSLQRRLAAEGSTVSQCVREARMDTAMTLLQGTDLAVAEIAALSGYDSHSRFSAAFRRRFGYAPSRLRP